MCTHQRPLITLVVLFRLCFLFLSQSRWECLRSRSRGYNQIFISCFEFGTKFCDYQLSLSITDSGTTPHKTPAPHDHTVHMLSPIHLLLAMILEYRKRDRTRGILLN